MKKSRFAVLGDPIAHSLSPKIHQAFAAQKSMSIDYEKILVKKSAFAETVLALQKDGFKGVNVTQPHKEMAYQLVDDSTAAASLSKAVNTLTFAEEIIGDNTDGIGLVTDLQNNLGFSLQKKRILLFGAGGVARGIIPCLLAKNPEVLCIINRTLDTVTALVAEFAHLGILQEMPIDALTAQRFDLVINAVSAAVDFSVWQIPPVCFHGAVIYNINYDQRHANFHAFVNEAGISSYYTGIGMLVEQAAEAFSRWHGFKPETTSVIQCCHGYF